MALYEIFKMVLPIKGSIVECGVFRGFMSAVITEVLDFAKCDKTFYLYDSFAGLAELGVVFLLGGKVSSAFNKTNTCIQNNGTGC